MEETLLILRQFFTEEVVHFSGQHYTITGLRSFHRSVQQPHPPIFLQVTEQAMDLFAPIVAQLAGK